MNQAAEVEPFRRGALPANEAASSAVSWAAIISGNGGVVAAASSLVLVALATGTGLASISPWADRGVSATTFTVMAAIGLIVIQWFSSGLGGYVAGRLRTKWTGTHTHEVFFRDTAHGFITWAAATLLVAALVGSFASTTAEAGLHGAGVLASGATGAAVSGSGVNPYSVDTLFRKTGPDSKGTDADARVEATRILRQGLLTGDIPAADRTYLAQLVSAQAEVSESDAQRRVDNVISQTKTAEAQARKAADTVRKAAELSSLCTALSMLVGAFIACVAAALGGRQRDLHP